MTKLDYDAIRRAPDRRSGTLGPTERQMREIDRLLAEVGRQPAARAPTSRGDASRLIELLRKRVASQRRTA